MNGRARPVQVDLEASRATGAPRRGPVWGLTLAWLAACSCQAQPSAGSGTASGAPAATLQRVEVTGGAADSTEERRNATAGKIVYGRDEIDRMGDSSLGEILKRLPGVTVSGRPGRGGAPRMRGLGNGYTQILIDGERMPRGFSLDAIEPDQIERIEIIRAPTAETGARAIAGTINIVLREDFRRKRNDLRVALSDEHGRPGASAAWTVADKADGFDYTWTATARRGEQGESTRSRTLEVDAAGTPTLDQQLDAQSHSWSEGGFLTSRLRWQLGRDRIELQPYLGVSQSRGSGTQQLQQSVGADAAPYATGDFSSRGRNAMGRIHGSWLHFMDDGARLLLRAGGSLASSESDSATRQFAQDGSLVHERLDGSSQRDTSFTQGGRYARLLAERHSLVTGWELQANRRTDRRSTFDNGVAELTEFGDNVQATTRRIALYAQDEWDLGERFSLNAGLRWEGIATRSESALQSVSNTSRVLTPLLHMVWRLPGSQRDQLRIGLTRSYRTPTTAQLIARPTLSSQYPSGGPNEPTSPDRMGNPALKPEIARGLDVALEHYLPEGGIVSSNVYVRRIRDLIRNVRSLQAVSWSPVPRWVAQPQNVGGAWAAGLELEAKLRAADLWATKLPLSLRGNATLMASRVDQVPGPDNRLDQQPRYTANLGFDYAATSMPLTVGANINFTPAFTVRQMDAQIYQQGVKRVLDAYAVWRFSPQTLLRLSVSNAAPRDYANATTVLLDDGSSQRKDVVARTFMTTTLRLEMRF